MSSMLHPVLQENICSLTYKLLLISMDGFQRPVYEKVNNHSLIYLLSLLHDFISPLPQPLIYLFSRLTTLEIDEFMHSRKKKNL